MNRQLTISYRLQDHDQMVHFGVPENQQEVQHMYQLRYRAYVEKKQCIPAHLCPDGLDIDHIDRKGGCSYFVAHCDEHLVGAMRLIWQDPLPIRQYYWRFEEPVDMRGLHPHQKVQIGRLGSYRPLGIIIPPSLVPLGLIHCATHFCLAHDV